mgnify:CR=1 FL=1
MTLLSLHRQRPLGRQRHEYAPIPVPHARTLPRSEREQREAAVVREIELDHDLLVRRMDRPLCR